MTESKHYYRVRTELGVRVSAVGVDSLLDGGIVVLHGNLLPALGAVVIVGLVVGRHDLSGDVGLRFSV
jgi:hypothetical protein